MTTEARPNRWARWLPTLTQLATLIGLALVILQLQHDRDLKRAEIRHELSMGIVTLLNTPASDRQFASVVRRGSLGEALPPDEQFQFELRSNALLRYWENVHYQYREGLYDQVEFSSQRDAWRATLDSATGLARYWCSVRALYSPSFMVEMDALLQAGCGDPDAGDPGIPSAAAEPDTARPRTRSGNDSALW